MYNDIAERCRICEECLKVKSKSQKNKGKLKLFPAHELFETVHIDIVGPLPQTNDEYRYILFGGRRERSDMRTPIEIATN